MSVKVVQVYQTTDGKTFVTEKSAVRHQQALDLADELDRSDLPFDYGRLRSVDMAEWILEHYTLTPRTQGIPE